MYTLRQLMKARNESVEASPYAEPTLSTSFVGKLPPRWDNALHPALQLVFSAKECRLSGSRAGHAREE